MQQRTIRRRLAAIFPGAFLRRDCRCVLHIAGAEDDPHARVLGVTACRPCGRAARARRVSRPEVAG